MHTEVNRANLVRGANQVRELALVANQVRELPKRGAR
jgi:hypothetical protein